jgi:hypothetical protein
VVWRTKRSQHCNQLREVVQDRLRRRFPHFKLGAHFLETRSESFNLLLLLGYGRLLLLDLPVLFEELVEQHRVDRVVAHGMTL